MGDRLEAGDKLGSIIAAFLALVALASTIGTILQRRRAPSAG